MLLISKQNDFSHVYDFIINLHLYFILLVLSLLLLVSVIKVVVFEDQNVHVHILTNAVTKQVRQPTNNPEEEYVEVVDIIQLCLWQLKDVNSCPQVIQRDK